MRCRPVDEYGDMVPVKTADEMITDEIAIALAIDARLGLAHGEWWENRKLGFRIPEIMVQAARKQNKDMIVQYITQYLASMPDVREVTEVETEIDDLRMYIDCTVLTDLGEVEVGVDEDVLFSAVY